MKCQLTKVGTIASVVLLALAIAGCGTGSMMMTGPNDGEGGNGGGNGNGNGDGGPPGMGAKNADANGGPPGMGAKNADANGGPPGMGAKNGNGNGGPPGMGAKNAEANGGPPGMGGTSSAGGAQGAAAGSASGPAAVAASAGPAFGSVTQSSNVDSNGVSSDRARTTFSQASGVGLTITHEDGNTVSLDAANHRINADTDPSDTVEDFHLYDYSATEFTLARVLTVWTSGDHSDYLALGYWLHATGDLDNDGVDAVEIGAFVDGPKLRGTPTVPVTGTATYEGLAAGLYSTEAGTDASYPQGTHELGEFLGDMELTADFGDATISGTVDDVRLLYYTGVRPDGTRYEGTDVSTNFELHLGETSFDSSGRFTGRDVTLTHPDFAFQSTTGAWGGKFSTLDVDDNGIPDVVGGTAGGTASTSGGTSVTFVGGYFGRNRVAQDARIMLRTQRRPGREPRPSLLRRLLARAGAGQSICQAMAASAIAAIAARR